MLGECQHPLEGDLGQIGDTGHEWDALRAKPAAARVAGFRREGISAGSWRHELAERGITVRQADCLIAAAALGVGADLATANVSDFPMSEIEIDHWPISA